MGDLTDTELLDWVGANVQVIFTDLNERYVIEYTGHSGSSYVCLTGKLDFREALWAAIQQSAKQ